MKHVVLSACCAAAVFAAASAQAHFQLLYTPDGMLEAPAELNLKLVFAHPMENGHVMDMGEPEDFFVVFRGEKTDLKKSLKPITWKGAHNEAKAYQASHKVTRNGDYIFALTPAPYFEKSEDGYIQQFTKTYVNRGGLPTGWNEPLGLPAEIVPLNKPYQIFAGGTFTGQALAEGQPAAGVECEVEWINTTVDLANNAFGKETLGTAPVAPIVAITDANGVFTFGLPKPGIWGFACLGVGPKDEHEGKELSQDAVLWIHVVQL